MPPKPAHRRSARVSSREPEEPFLNESPGQLVRPRLPALQGTPSSRRQYGYGSAAEPPARPGAGLHRIDLTNAVSEALTRRQQDIGEGTFKLPPKPQKRSEVKDADEDELAREPRTNGRKGGTKPQKSEKSLSSIDNILTSLSYDAVESKPSAWDIDPLSAKHGRQ